ncbi:MAG TPA: YihY/virulence factor BrkB family protein [Nocardioidaceae bacterium]|nr:YihY/virulence factor BrkB family protein [Nocardioidaceae bacterium]
MPDLVDRFDAWQRRRRAVGIPIAVIYKFFDDQGGYLAAVITYYAFVAIFPLMLIGSSVLGFVLQGQPDLQQEILSSVLAQFPIVGDQLGRPEGLQGSASAVIIGSVAALYGVIGLGQAAHNAINVCWAVPRNIRLNPILSRLRSLVWIVGAGLSLVFIAVVTSVGSHLDVLGRDFDREVHWLALLLSVLVNAYVLGLMMRLSTPRRERLRDVLPGAALIAVLWQLLQLLGGVYVEHVIKKTNEMNAVFALVLGLIALVYIATVLAMLGIEVNVVLIKRLYPRALLTPFTDAVELTEADKRVYREYAQAQRHKGFEEVQVSFGDGDDA